LRICSGLKYSPSADPIVDNIAFTLWFEILRYWMLANA
jgi:hypothetical protein